LRLNAPMDPAKEDLRLSTPSGQKNGHDAIMSDLDRRVDETRTAALGVRRARLLEWRRW
jgi:hypothetical protein